MKRNDILIEADELLSKLGNDNLRIYDASLTDGVYRQEHLPGAAFFNHAEFSDPNSLYADTLLSEAALLAQVGRAGISSAAEVVVYACGMLPYAVRAWWLLRYAGHSQVRVLNGGLAAWKAAGGQTEQAARRYAPAGYTGRLRPGMFASKEEVLAAMADGEVATVNVLPLESYAATHIVGSTCLPCLDLMRGMDYFLPDDQLALRLKEVSHHQRIITYCGGGIAATINAAAHLMTGHTNVAVYDGSLYEWLGEGLPVNGQGEWEIWRQK
ncbi:MAG: sulfurtransferase [Anaerolineales bacterium]|nr:sulfurtransferase [Anaerolineales bacterium]